MYSVAVDAAYTGTNSLVAVSQTVSDRASQSYGDQAQPPSQDDQAQNQYIVSDREEIEDGMAPFSRTTRNVQTGAKSKKSLKSIVDRLSRQTNLETPNQQLVTTFSSSGLQDFNPELSVYTHVLGYDQNYAPCEEALDLSMKRPQVSYTVADSNFESQTDTCGALDLSISNSKRFPPAHQRDSDSPEFVLDLTTPSQWYSPRNADAESQFSGNGSVVSTQPVEMYPQESNERDQDDFQTNHLRVIEFLANHTIQRKVTGEEVDIDLLTCRYCRYSSTEKSCMMAHLTTTHVSKRRRGNGNSQRYVNSQSVENTKYERMAQSPFRGNSNYLNVEPKPKKSRYSFKSSEVSNGHPFSRPGGSGVATKYSQLIELSPDGRALLPNQSQDPETHHQNTPILLQDQSKPVKLQSEAVHIKYPTSQMTYIIGEGGLRSHPMYGSILQDRLMLHNSNLSPSSSTTSDSADTIQDVSVGASTSYTPETKHRQFKLSQLCRKLAKRMDKQNHSGGVTEELRGQSSSSDQLKSVSKRSQGDAVGQKRQDLISETGTFSCSFCSKTFTRRLSLYGHLKQHSPLLKKHRKGNFQCENCPQIFASLNSLFLHIQDEHVQDGEFRTQSNLNANKVKGSDQETMAVVKPVDSSQGETRVKEEGNRKRKKMKPYGLRQKARRDYLLDHDPMADYLNCEFPFNLQGTSSGVSDSHDDQNSLKVTSKKVKQDKGPEHVTEQRLQRKYRKVSKDMKALLRLRKPNKVRKPNKWRRNHRFSSGITWRKMCRKSKSKFLKCSLASVQKYLSRKNDGNRETGFECKHCSKVVRPLWQALRHLRKCHVAFTLKKQSSFHRKMKLQADPSHLEDVAVPKPAKENNDLFIKITQAGVEKSQCKLCLEVIQENDLLARHFKMHKDIFEGSNRAFSSEDDFQNAKHNKFGYSESMHMRNTPPLSAVGKKNQSHPTSTLEMSNHMVSSKLTNDADRPWNGLVTQQVETFQFSRKESGVDNNCGGPTARGISPKLEHQSVRRVGSPSKSKHQMGTVFQSNDHAFRSQLAQANGIQKFVCTVCSFGTVFAQHITKHMRKHCKAILECDQCKYQTVEKRFIIRHVQTVHEQRKPYTCELCVYSTAYKHHLKRHYRSHSVDLLACAKCSFCTLQEGKLQEHMLEHDTSSLTSIICEQCSITFPNSKMLEEHLADRHNKVISKDNPPPSEQENGMEPVSPSAEIIEAKFEKYSCNACRFSSEKSSSLMSHMLEEHMRTETVTTDVTLPTIENNSSQEENSPGTDLSVQCPQCGFITSHDQLDAHLETHNGDETYACEHCPFETKSLDVLQKHKGKHSKHKVSLTCLQCNQVQTDTLSLRDHTRIHLNSISENNMFRCSLCAFTTHSPQDGEHHLDQHNYVMEFKCQICMYSSPSISGLTSHRRLHRKIKPTTHTQKRTSPSKMPFQDGCINVEGK